MEFPVPPRPGQAELARALHRVQTQGKHGVFEAATGTGKTLAAVVASLETIRDDHRRIVYATRTNSQQAQVIAEHARAGADGLLVPFMGRRQYCPHLMADERYRDGSSEELGRLCRDAKRKATQGHETGKPVRGACPNFQRLLEDGTGPVEALLKEGLGPEELGRRIAGCGSCPYESLKALLPKADAVVLPYVFLVDDRLRNLLVSWLGCSLDETHLVFDEAHNLPDAVRGHHSPRLSTATLKRALREAEEYDDPTLAGKFLSTSLLHAVEGVLYDLVNDFIHDGEDGRVPPGAFEEGLMERLRCPSPLIDRAAKDLETWGDIIRDDRRMKGRLPRSHLGSVGTFLRFWMAAAEAPYVHLVTAGDHPAVEAYLLDPSSVMGWLHEAASTVHMSGTLSPTADHVTLCGLGEAVERVAPSPFRADQLQVFGVYGLHRRWQQHQDDPRHAADQQDAARRLLSTLSGNTGLFFPSRAMMDSYLEEGFLHGLGRPVYIERSDATTADLMRMVERFKADPHGGALLLGVLGGRLTEGIDFPGDALQNLLIFGIPYPKPTARSQALIDHMDRVTGGDGWRVAVHNPVGRVLRQAVGRLVRGPDDHGTAIVLDERVARFRGHLSGMIMVDDVDEIRPGATFSQEEGFVEAGQWGAKTALRPRTQGP